MNQQIRHRWRIGRRINLIFVCSLLFKIIAAQPNLNVDSLERIFPTSSKSEQANICHLISWSIYKNDTEKGLRYAKLGLKLTRELKNEPNFKMEDLAAAHSILGNVHLLRNEFSASIEHLLASYHIADSIGNKKPLAGALLNLGNAFQQQKNYSLALDYYEKALKIKREINDEKGIMNALINVGGVYVNTDRVKESVKLFEEAKVIAIKNKDARSMAMINGNLGVIYRRLENYPKALGCYLDALNYKRKGSDKNSLIQTLINIGVLYNVTDSIDKALTYFDEAANFAKVSSAKDLIPDIMYNQANAYYKKNDFKRAYDLTYAAKQISDSMYTEAASKKIAEMQAKFDVDKKQKELELISKESKLKELESQKKSKEIDLLVSEKRIQDFEALTNHHQIQLLKNHNELKQKEARAKSKEIELLSKDKQVQDAEIHKQNVQKIAFAIGFALMIILAFVIYRSLRINRKSKHIIERQKELVEEKQKEVMDSIHYAKRIQQSLLPTNNYIHKNLRRMRNDIP